MDYKKDKGNKSNFDILASDLTKKERKDFLNKINPADIEIKIPTAEESRARMEAEDEKELAANTKKGLEKKFKEEPFLKKFVVWVKSLFLNVSVEELYNNAVVNALAKQIERVYPGLINYRHRYFASKMYQQLSDLKIAQDFFKDKITSMEADSGVFYYLLADTLMPAYMEEIKKICDPFQYSLDRPLGQDTRTTLLNRLDEKLAAIPLDVKNKISVYAQSYEWLRMFCKIPLDSMMSKFSVSSEGRSCLFVQIRHDFNDIARIISAPVSFADEFFKSLFLSSENQADWWNPSGLSLDQDELLKQVESASAEISNVNIFSKNVPVKVLGKIVHGNSLYVPELFSPGDNWFQKFRETWRTIFDRRWRVWNKEFKKEELKKKLKIFFSLNDFQKFPYHPWRKYSLDFPFEYDLSLGFVNYYMKQEYSKYATFLNVVTLEGDFQIKENRHEFTDLVADFNGIMDSIDILVQQVSVGGEFGAEFMRYESSIKNKSHREKLQTVVDEIEESAAKVVDVFISACHKSEILIKAMLGEHTTVYYGPLTNLNKIMGRDNREFRQALEKFSHSVKYASEIMTGIREVDTFKI